MSDVLVITRNGEGDVWRFTSLRAVRLSPIVQTYDVVASSSEFLLQSYGRSGCESLGRRAPIGYVGDGMRRALTRWSESGAAPDDEVLSVVSDLWKLLLKEARVPPTAAEDVVATIVADRTAMENSQVRVMSNREAFEEENEVTEAARASRIHDTTIIHLGHDKDGKKLGKDNNPTRVGSAVHSRFAKYKDGMTVVQAKNAGITPGDIKYHAHADRGWITLKPDLKAEAAEAKAAEAKAAEAKEDVKKNEAKAV